MPPPAERAGLAIDACGVLNLAGAGVDSGDLADALGVPLLVVEQVAAEALWIEDVVDGDVVRVPVDLRASVFAAVTRVALAESELGLYVALARELDDGESATLAMARTRRLVVLTDDRKARRVARGLALEVVGTAQILRQLTEHRGVIEESRPRRSPTCSSASSGGPASGRGKTIQTPTGGRAPRAEADPASRRAAWATGRPAQR